MTTHPVPPAPPDTLDLTAILNRSERAYAAVRDEGDGFVPPAVREHFNYDVPALIGALRRRNAQIAAIFEAAHQDTGASRG